MTRITIQPPCVDKLADPIYQQQFRDAVAAYRRYNDAAQYVSTTSLYIQFR